MASVYGLGALKGLLVTLSFLGRKSFTKQYPEERASISPRFRGNTFVWYEERCTGCASCAKACPLGIIRIVTHPTPQSDVGNAYFVDKFDIDTGRCMFCALCVEACPYDALFMGGDFEQSTYIRDDLVIHKEDLVAMPKRPTQQLSPHLETLGYRWDGEAELDEHQAGRWSL